MQADYPDDWFDFTESQLADFGAMMFLSSLVKVHQRRTLLSNFRSFETPWRLGQYHIFRATNGSPRAFMTYAALSEEAERAYALDQHPIEPEDWAAGQAVWIIDLVAPFGQVPQIVEMIKRDAPFQRVRTNRLTADMETQRIVEWVRDAEGKVHMSVIRPRDFRTVAELEA
ncbi:toxin-activating lysine-acyltransferase [Oceanomicrobium pacificus]|uniref:RTX toxin-activating lysine-acyltransferase n=1 Tax=Oceanomicrobium pacificus TaxID=2692916 RepID=A0A6B0TYE9_9RHOB|nr:toxin-activating lysine-acyltransferase [Oceanomicrobium pacificus]MXU66725.1 toxin-activating lysine-acyltransferase [Oceanomicrobium pacificus]